MFTDDKFLQVCETFRAVHEHKSGDALLARHNEIHDRMAELKTYARRSGAQDDELDELNAELTVLDVAISDRKVLARSEAIAARSAEISRIRRVATDPANLEGPDAAVPSGRVDGAPMLVRNPGTRPESAAETIQRAGNPWRAEDGAPLTGHTSYGVRESGQGLISRAHTAIEAYEDTLGHDGAEKLARQLLADSYGWPGMTVQRSRQECEDAAALVLALSSPHYLEAFRSVLRYPMEFTAGGTGFETLPDQQRQAWRDVRTNDLVRASFAESSGATGAYALPLQLDDSLIYTNAGAAGPFRKLSRTVVGTSNTWNGVTTAGVTASWTAEAAATSDGTPAVGQLVITPYKQTAWITGSLEVVGDTSLDAQVPGLIADARTRLEATAFTAGTGSGQPFGVVTRAASDAATGALSAAQIYGLLASLGPRFRLYDGARPSWLANIANINAARQVPKFTGANFSIVDDSPADNIPEMLGIDFNEASAMSALNTTGAKNLLIGDMSQYVVVDRLPTVMIFEPLVFNSTPAPTGQQGWYYYARVGADITTAGAAFGANAFSIHTV